jgi:exopolysaccharide production protein ExoZ
MGVEIVSRSSKKYDLIEAMRFIAAFSVVITHVSFYTFERLDNSLGVYGLGANGVHLFFVISGFVMIVSSRKLIDVQNGWLIFSLRRIARIAPIYWIMTTFKLLLLLISTGLILHSEFDIAYVLKSYLFIPSLNLDGEMRPLYGVGWTLCYEMFFYLIFAIALKIRISPAIFSSVFILFLVGYSLIVKPENIYVKFFTDSIMIDFIFGILVGLAAIRNIKMPTILAIILIFVCFCYLFLPLSVFGIADFNRSSTFGFTSFLLIFAAVSLEHKYSFFLPKVVTFLGAASYSIYMVHPTVGPIVPKILSMISIHSALLSIAISAIVSIIVASIFYGVVERPITLYLTSKIENKVIKSAETQELKI